MIIAHPLPFHVLYLTRGRLGPGLAFAHLPLLPSKNLLGSNYDFSQSGRVLAPNSAEGNNFCAGWSLRGMREVAQLTCRKIRSNLPTDPCARARDQWLQITKVETKVPLSVHSYRPTSNRHITTSTGSCIPVAVHR